MNIAQVNQNLEDLYTLSQFQKENLVTYLNMPGEGVFHMNLLFMIKGKVDIDLFKKSWEDVVKRHTVLRTSFHYKDMKEPHQAVHRNVELPFEVLDWCILEEEDQRKKLNILMENDHMQDYVLEKAPLMRLTLILTGPNTLKLWWRFHSLLMDGWAFALVLSDVLILYYNYLEGNMNLKLQPAYPYREYIAWSKNRDTKKEETFWRSYLDGFIPQNLIKLAAPTDNNNLTTVRHKRIDYDISELYEPLQRVIRDNEITLNTVFQGIYLLVMSYYSGSKLDMVTGATVADRPLSLENSHLRVGLCMNNIPIRFKIEPNRKFVDWARDLQTSNLKVFQYSSASEQEIKKWCNFPKDNFIFQSALIFENIPIRDNPFQGLKFEITDYSLESRPKYPMNLFVWPGTNFTLKMVYDSKQFSEDSVKSTTLNIKKVLENFSNNPQIFVKQLMKF